MTATWPIPSPSRASRRCTRKVPIAGAALAGEQGREQGLCMKSWPRRSTSSARLIGRPPAGRATSCRGADVRHVVVPGVDGVVVAVHVLVRERWSVVRDPAVTHRPRSTSGSSGPRLVGDQDDRGAAPTGCAARRPAPAGWAGRRPRWARRGRTGRLARERARDEHPLLLPAGERGDAVSSLVAEADDLERVVDGRPVGASGRTQQAAAGESPGRHDLPLAGTPPVAVPRWGT